MFLVAHSIEIKGFKILFHCMLLAHYLPLDEQGAHNSDCGQAKLFLGTPLPYVTEMYLFNNI